MAKQAALDEVSALYSQFDILKQKLVEFQQKQKDVELEQQESLTRKKQVEELLQSREEHIILLQHSIGEAEVRIQETLSEQQYLQDGLGKAHQDYEDAEARLKVAHHHLAKKVRETTELNDRVQFLERDLHEQQSLNDTVQERMRDLEALYESRSQQEQSLQEKLDVAARDLEEISSRWEHKYTLLNDRYLLAEAKLKDFKKLEEKYQRMQNLLSHINGMFDAEAPLKDFVEAPSDLIPQKCEQEESQDPKRPFQNLFDMHRPKSHFFE
jgi:chromosome segregation ATPase